MQFNSSLNRKESILALTQVTKEQKVQELSLSVTRMSPNGFCMQARDWEEREKRLLRTTIYYSFTFGLLWILIWTRPQTTSQVQVKLTHSLSIFLALMQWMRVSKKVDTLRRNRKKVEEGRQKGVKGSH